MSDLVGTTLKSRYFLRELIGSGGMADVYLAWDNKRSTQMAIKVLRQQLADNEQITQMFDQEAGLLQQLEHPNIVRLYEFEHDEELAFLVMEWIDGSNLRQAIEQHGKPYDPDFVLSILNPICAALYYTHQNNVLHCDIKPANIMLHKDGRVLLADFGVARLATESRAVGTPAYMAPEQFRHEPISPATDIYALGITIYELLAGGQLPFRGKTSSSQGKSTRERISWEHQNIPPSPVYKVNSKIPPDIDRVVQKALAKDPKERYQSVLALRDEFDAAKPKKLDQQRTTFTLPSPELPKIVQRIQTISRPSPPPSDPHISKPLPGNVLRFFPVTQALPSGPIWVGRRGTYAGYAVQIPSGETMIGRISSAHIHLSEPSVSRQHAIITRTRRGVYLRDLQSRMGTFINGVRIPTHTDVKLHTGDVIQFGYNQIFEHRG